MPSKDTPSATGIDVRRSASFFEAKGKFNEGLLDLALNCRDYYGDNDLAADVLRSKYLAPNEQGPLHLWHRIAKAISSVETDK